MGIAIEPKHHGPDQQCRTVPLTGGEARGAIVTLPQRA